MSENAVLDTWSKQEQENAENGRREALQAQNDELEAEYEAEANPRRRWFHKFCIIVSIVTGISALAMGVGQFFGVTIEDVSPTQYIIRVFIIAMCILVVFNELEWTVFTRDSKILNIWITRGLFYFFIGILGMEEYETAQLRKTVEEKDIRQWFKIAIQYVRGVSGMMMVCGGLYFLMGCLCLQLVYNRMRADYQRRRERGSAVRETREKYGGRSGLTQQEGSVV